MLLIIFLSVTNGDYMREFNASDRFPMVFIPETADSIYNIGMSLCVVDDFAVNFDGIQGPLTRGDCGALFYLTTMLAKLELKNSNFEKVWFNEYLNVYETGFVYIETGSFMGLSANIVAEALKVTKTPGIVYCHDLFDDGDASTSLTTQPSDTGSLWDSYALQANRSKTRLARFYEHVWRKKLNHVVIPIAGKLSVAIFA